MTARPYASPWIVEPVGCGRWQVVRYELPAPDGEPKRIAAAIGNTDAPRVFMQKAFADIYADASNSLR